MKVTLVDNKATHVSLKKDGRFIFCLKNFVGQQVLLMIEPPEDLNALRCSYPNLSNQTEPGSESCPFPPPLDFYSCLYLCLIEYFTAQEQLNTFLVLALQ